jgi:hypothetical protein
MYVMYIMYVMFTKCVINALEAMNTLHVMHVMNIVFSKQLFADGFQSKTCLAHMVCSLSISSGHGGHIHA